MKWAIGLFLAAGLIFALYPGVSASNMSISLTIPDTSNQLYLQRVGDVGPGQWLNNLNYYLSSYGGNMVYALVQYRSFPLSFTAERSQENQTITLTQELGSHPVFLVFTRGGPGELDSRMPSVIAGTFLERISPTFGFGLGILYPVKMVLHYPFDLDGSLVVEKGTAGLSIESLRNSTVISQNQ